MHIRKETLNRSPLDMAVYVSITVVYLALPLIAVTPAPVFARPYVPPSYWVSSYGGTESEDAFSILRTSDEGYLVGGSTQSFGEGSADMLILKLNADGAIQWQRTYGGDGIEYLMHMQQTADGGYVVAGGTETDAYSAGHRDLWLLKLDAGGNIQWQNAYGGPDEDGPAFAVRQTADDGFITAGRTRESTLDMDILVLKIDASGDIEWQRQYGGDGIERRAENIVLTPDGGYILIGTSHSFTPEASLWVLKLDATGGIQWQKVYRDADAEDIQPTSDGGYILLAESQPRPGDQDFWVVKLAEDGEIEWQKAYGGTGDEDAQPIRQTRDGGYVLAGSTTSFGVVDEDVWIVKLDVVGSIEWEWAYGGPAADEIIALEQISGVGYVAAGGTDSFGTGDKDFLVIKLNEEGGVFCCLPGFDVQGTSAIVTNTTVTPMDASGTSVESGAIRTPTDARAIDATASRMRRCFFQVSESGTMLECLSLSPWWRTQRIWWYGLFALGALGFAYAMFRWVRRRRDQQA